MKDDKLALLEKESLVKHDELLEQYKNFPEKIAQFEIDSVKITVNDDDSLMAAKTQLDNGKLIASQVETIRKVFKEPYRKSAEHIDAYTKLIVTPLLKAIDDLKAKNQAYIELKAARARAEAAEKAAEAAKLAAEKQEEVDAFERISEQLNARLYGGTFRLKDGRSLTVPGCKIVKDCDDLQAFVKSNFPDPTKYKYVEEQMATLKRDILVEIAKVQAAFVERKADAINDLKNVSQAKTDAKKEELKNNLAKEIKHENKVIAAEVNEAKKGLRKTLKIEIVDANLVPADFKTVDESLIKKYISENSEEVHKTLEQGEQVIPGVRLFYENVFVNR